MPYPRSISEKLLADQSISKGKETTRMRLIHTIRHHFTVEEVTQQPMGANIVKMTFKLDLRDITPDRPVSKIIIQIREPQLNDIAEILSVECD